MSGSLHLASLRVPQLRSLPGVARNLSASANTRTCAPKRNKMVKKRITLIRHGMPEAHHKYSTRKMLKGSELIEYISDWNKSELSSDNTIPKELREHITDSDKYINSKFKRTKDSFRLLGINETESIELLNEADLPHGFLKDIYLPVVIWGILIRLLWAMGYHKNSESYGEFKKRIKNAYDYIDSQSDNSEHVVIMGHGFTNMQLKKVIKKNNWNHVMNYGGHSYWSFDYFEKEGRAKN